MKNKGYFAASMAIVAVSLIMIFVGAGNNKIIISILSLFAGLIMLIHWSTISYKWICEKCGENFEINMWQNIVGINGGVNYKKLYCPKCKQRNWARGISK